MQQVVHGRGGGFGHVPVQDSVFAEASTVVAPVFDPAGFGEWQTASALVVGFVAKQALISSWAQTYATAEPTGSDPGSLGAFSNGAGSLSDVARRTGLDRDVVHDAAVEHLVRMGRLQAGTLSTGCPDGGCGSCASGDDGAAGCGSSGPSAARSGPVLVTLGLRPTRA